MRRAYGIFWFIALVAVLAAADYAEGGKMVVVIDPDSGNVEQVIDATSITLNNDNTITGAGRPADRDTIGNMRANIQSGTGRIRQGRFDELFPNYTVIRTHSSPGCVTYRYGNYSWTVCN